MTRPKAGRHQSVRRVGQVNSRRDCGQPRGAPPEKSESDPVTHQSRRESGSMTRHVTPVTLFPTTRRGSHYGSRKKSR